MKSFDEFLSTLSTKAQEDALSLALSKLTASGEIFSEKEFKLALLISQAVGKSTCDLMRQYHDWLTEQMH